MNPQQLIHLLFGVRKDASNDIKTIKAGAFDRICAELDRAEFEAAEMDELLNAHVNAYNCEGTPVPVPVPVPAEGPFYVLMTPEAAPENTPPAAEEPAAPIPAEDPGAAPRRRGRPRKPTIEAPTLLPTPDEAPAEPTPEPTAELAPEPTTESAGDDVPWW